MPAEVGQQAPDFTLKDTDRKDRSLNEFRGKNVVLAFLPGAFTGVCTQEACAFRDNTDKYNGLNAQVVAVTVDSPFAQKGWADANNLQFPILSDYQRKVVTDYGVALPNFAGLEGYTSTSRAVFVIDKGGVIRYKWVASPPTAPEFAEIEKALNNLK